MNLPRREAAGVRCWSPWPLICGLLAGLLALDAVPRFFQGDSIVYLGTGSYWVPPDRSWAYGYLVNALLRWTHGYVSLLVLQSAALAAAVAIVAGAATRITGTARLGVAVAVLACLDPLLATTARFYMTDLIAMACFIGFVAELHVVASPAGRTLTVAAARAALWIVAAMFMRVAYLPVATLTVALLILVQLARREVAPVARLAIALALPACATLLLGAANTVVFRDQFHGEFFVNKLGGALLMGVFAPALDIKDFAHAGVAITPQQFAALQVGDYARRNDQVWGNSGGGVHVFVSRALGVTEPYSPAADAASAALVRSAALRKPWALVRVYAANLIGYFSPAEWSRSLDDETGFSHPLPDKFLGFFNYYSLARIDGGITAAASPVLSAYRSVARFYPWLLGGTALAALSLVAAERGRGEATPWCAAFFATLLAAPLYSLYVAPRFVLACVLLAYLLCPLAIARLVSPPRRRGIVPLGR